MSEEAATEGTPRRSRKVLIASIAAVLVLGGGGGAYYAFAGKSEDASATPVVEVKVPPQFVELNPPFVVNFQPGSSARFLQVAVQVMTRDPAMVSMLQHLDPIIRNDLLLLFGNKQVADVSSPEGKEALRTATLEVVRNVVAAEDGNPEALEAVYFTSFVMQ